MKKGYFLLVLILSLSLIRVIAQVPPGHYIVTSDATGAGTGTFEAAYAAAISYANAGNHAYIEMNAPGLCKVDAPFPVCTLATNAKITIRKADILICPVLQSPNQGFTKGNLYNVAPIGQQEVQNILSFYQDPNSNNQTVEVFDLIFFNFNQLYSGITPTYAAQYAIINSLHFLNIENASISGCLFEEVPYSILSQNSTIYVTNNVFRNTIGVTFETIIQQQKSCLVVVEGNDFFIEAFSLCDQLINVLHLAFNVIDPNFSFYVGFAILNIFHKDQSNYLQKFSIKNNTFFDESKNFIGAKSAIWIDNPASVYDFLLKLEINNNIVKSIRPNLTFVNPMKHFVVDNNNLEILTSPLTNSDQGYNIIANADMGNYSGLDFISSNSFGYPIINGNNTFVAPSQESYYQGSFRISQSKYRTTFNIINQVLPGKILVSEGVGIFARGNSITAKLLSDNPIQLATVYSNENNNLGNPPFSISTLNINNNNIIATYLNLTNLNNKKCLIDLYTSNNNGDLVTYVGSFDANLTGGVSQSINAPLGINLSSATRFAYVTNTYDLTAFNLGDLNNTDHSGSSKASYIEVANITHCCPNIQASLTLNGTTYTYNSSTPSQTVSGCFGELMMNVNNCGSSDISPYHWLVSGMISINGSPYPFAYTFNNSNQTFVIPENATSVSVTLENTDSTCSFSWTVNFNPLAPCTLPCIDCIGSFAPIPEHKYVLSAWVKEDIPIENRIDLINYTNAKIVIEFEMLIGYPTPVILSPFMASGAIIDTWQRIEEEFTIPTYATDIKISLQTANGIVSYFDDVRVFPAKGNMKSFVYDPESKRLVAELDERNYATFYEYNEEGKLTRIKKETEKGIYTIKESRSSLMKK